MRPPISALLLLSACHLYLGDRSSDEGEAEPPRPADAGPSPSDASIPPDPGDAVCEPWRRKALPIAAAELLDSDELRAGRSARVRIFFDDCPGDLPGLWRVTPSFEGGNLLVETFVWRRGLDCDLCIAGGTARAEAGWAEERQSAITANCIAASAAHLRSRVIAIELSEGTWTIPTLTQPLLLDVGSQIPGSCGADSPSDCQRDCDCDVYGELCLDVDGAGQRRCAVPCEYDRDCSGGRCTAAGVCSDQAPECDAGRPCPIGYACDLGVCAPEFVLNQYTRHGCSCDSDCDPGLHCADRPGANVGASCQVLCPTANGGWCQGAHTCEPGVGLEGASGFCEWLGE